MALNAVRRYMISPMLFRRAPFRGPRRFPSEQCQLPTLVSALHLNIGQIHSNLLVRQNRETVDHLSKTLLDIHAWQLAPPGRAHKGPQHGCPGFEQIDVASFFPAYLVRVIDPLHYDHSQER